MSTIELKNIQHSAFASEETYCYEAGVYFNGKRVGKVGNNGHGGCDHEYVEDHEGWAAMQAYIDSIPAEYDEVLEFDYKRDLEGFCADIMNNWLVLKDLKKALNKKALITNPAGEVMEMGYKGRKKPDERLFDHAKKQFPEGTLLNTLPIEDALKLYRGC